MNAKFEATHFRTESKSYRIESLDNTRAEQSNPTQLEDLVHFC